MLRIALRATALRTALDPGDHCCPWEQEKRAGQSLPRRARAHQGQPHPGNDHHNRSLHGLRGIPVRRGIDGELDDHKGRGLYSEVRLQGHRGCRRHPGPHPRRHLGRRQEYSELRLARWAHQFGYGGHFSTRSRRYSVTLTSRRAEHRAWRDNQNGIGERPVTILSEWHYAGTGQPPDPAPT